MYKLSKVNAPNNGRQEISYHINHLEIRIVFLDQNLKAQMESYD